MHVLTDKTRNWNAVAAMAAFAIIIAAVGVSAVHAACALRSVTQSRIQADSLSAQWYK